jgi:hypothetical protein
MSLDPGAGRGSFDSVPSSGGTTWTFHKDQIPALPPASERTIHFNKEAASPPARPAWEPYVPAAPAPLPEPLLALQAPKKDAGPMGARGGDESLQVLIPLEPPGPARLFKLDTEAELYERMRQDARNQGLDNRINFPEEAVVSRDKYKGRSFPPAVEVAEPYYVCYNRLLFQEINSERYGWDLGAVGPLVDVGSFFFNLATVPYHLATRPFDQMECSAGYCLPGDPVPYLAYPPELSMTGITVEGLAAAALFTIFP